MVEINPEQDNTTYANIPNAKKPFQRNKLHIVRELGHGNFGKVLLAQAEGILERSEVTLVAVKTLKGKMFCNFLILDLIAFFSFLQLFLHLCL